MFGDNKQDDQAPADGQVATTSSGQPEPTIGQPFNMDTPPTTDTTATPVSEPTSAPTTDIAEPTDQPTGELPVVQNQDAPDPASSQALATPSDDDAATDTGSSTDLTGIKQQALQQLTPLVDHLDQTPEERFRTTMMMIQAADNKDLVKTAYDAAQQIKDEKERAQALLDVINEINYFTQQEKKQAGTEQATS